MIPVKVAKLSLSNVGFVILLQGHEDKRSLPVFIGAAEAQAIAIKIEGVKVPRPMTHDLLKNILDCIEWRLKRVEVCDLIENTFYARLIMEHDGTETPVDSRPSDAIALALRCETPIFVDEKVMDKAGIVVPAKEAGGDKENAVETKAHRLTPVEELKHQLEKAVEDERYEAAAKLRDEIKRLEHPTKTN